MKSFVIVIKIRASSMLLHFASNRPPRNSSRSQTFWPKPPCAPVSQAYVKSGSTAHCNDSNPEIITKSQGGSMRFRRFHDRRGKTHRCRRQNRRRHSISRTGQGKALAGRNHSGAQWARRSRKLIPITSSGRPRVVRQVVGNREVKLDRSGAADHEGKRHLGRSH